ncbi:universal stress protein [candidate division KSB1 bacterium]|nr:universal stress protein [candidate division KSB1 bacterium]NIR70616.1 universal stress protein [candidate division KSB1 bacterium]NIS24561.1 universal stress protein [candidate division KSB1 bacterium]NIT71479.1 universal stress protein [candidate division KSB1 bacterium]NIU25170.1 universal stress protein [candidate division KSB1 bacterium]
MAKIEHILMPTDFSESANQALRYGVMLADKLGSVLTLFHVICLHQDDRFSEEQHFPDLRELYGKMEKNAILKMDEFTFEYDNVQVNKLTIRGISPAEEIVNYALLNDVDLIVMGSHGRSGITHFLIGSVAEKVVRHANCPVLTVAHQKQEMYSFPKLKSILMPMDFSKYSKQALPYAFELAEIFGASLKLLHVIDQRVHPSYYVMGEQSIFRVYPDLLDKSMAKLKEFVSDEIPEHIKAQFHVREGNPYSEIVKFGKNDDIDLIVMATHGLSGLEKLLIGSTTEKVVRKADRPVFTVKAT